MNKPTEAAMNAARAIVEPHLWEDTAHTIDRECLLPEKHAALMLAQGVVEQWDRQCGRVFESMGRENPRAEAIDAAIEFLREALTRIQNPSSSAGSENNYRKESEVQPPEAGQEQAGSPS